MHVMPRGDDENLMLVQSQSQVDRLNKDFYSQFPYPWPPQTFDFITDQDLPRQLLNQNVGDWTHARVPPKPRIWIAGCGTNQAIYLALRHPDAHIVATDLSPVAIEICRRNAAQLGLGHLQLRNETLNEAPYRDEFDVVICTGVIHHNAQPVHALERLSAALAPSGLLELMVYNRFHRSVHSVFQKALRLLAGTSASDDRREELRVARRLAEVFPVRNRIRELLHAFRGAPESAFADGLIQPVEYSYTVESLAQMADQCGLELLCPVPNEWDVMAQPSDWHLVFGDDELQHRYDALPDVMRWQVSNLLLLERSPQLWFYLHKADSSYPRQSSAEMNALFLDTVFEPVKSTRGHYRRQPDGSYRRAARMTAFPASAPDADLQDVYRAVDGRSPMRAVLERLGRSMDFGDVLRYRTRLATMAFPFLRAKPSGKTSG